MKSIVLSTVLLSFMVLCALFGCGGRNKQATSPTVALPQTEQIHTTEAAKKQAGGALTDLDDAGKELEFVRPDVKQLEGSKDLEIAKKATEASGHLSIAADKLAGARGALVNLKDVELPTIDDSTKKAVAVYEEQKTLLIKAKDKIASERDSALKAIRDYKAGELNTLLWIIYGISGFLLLGGGGCIALQLYTGFPAGIKFGILGIALGTAGIIFGASLYEIVFWGKIVIAVIVVGLTVWAVIDYVVHHVSPTQMVARAKTAAQTLEAKLKAAQTLANSHAAVIQVAQAPQPPVLTGSVTK